MEKLETNEIVENDIVQDKVKNQNKVETKSNISKKAKPTHKTKECDVLVYNDRKHTAIISFDGFGYGLKNIKEDPGKKITVKYTGEIGSRNFKIVQ